MKTFSFFLLFLVVLVFADKAYHHTNYKFSKSKILYEYRNPPTSVTSQPPLTQEALDILAQPFTFFSKGSQAYAFLSADGQYVLKILKQHKFHPRTHFAYVPFLPQHADYVHRKKKAEKAFRSFQNAASGFCKETGLLGIHLIPDPSWSKQIVLIDKKGREHLVDINKTSFALQKKAELLYPTLTALMEKHDSASAKKRINSLMLLLYSLAHQGVVDNDPILRRNFGFVGDEAIQFDIGMFDIDPKRKGHILSQEELLPVTRECLSWLDERYPELADYLRVQWL